MTKFTTETAASGAAEAKLVRKFVEALLVSFATDGADAIKRLCTDNPSAYLRLIAGVQAPPGLANPIHGLTDDELEFALTFIRTAFSTGKRTEGGTPATTELKPARTIRALRAAKSLS